MIEQHCDHECVCARYQASHSDYEDEDTEACTFACMQRSSPPIPAPNCDGDCLSCDVDTYIICEKRINPEMKYTALERLDIKFSELVGAIEEKQVDGQLSNKDHGDYELVCYCRSFIKAELERERRSRPATLTHNERGDCLVICQHCGKVTQVQCKEPRPAPAPEFNCEPDKKFGIPSHPASMTWQECKAQKCCVIWSCPLRDQIAAQAREDMLDELEGLVNDKWEFMFGILPYNTEVSKKSIYKMIKSLRTGGERP